MRRIDPKKRAEIAAKRAALLAAEKAATDEARAAAVASVRFVDGDGMSARNAWLVVHQAKAAGFVPSMVGGFAQWRKLGRVPRRGSRGLLICFPRVTTDDGGADRLAGFGWACVFDVSQTVERGAAGGIGSPDDGAAADDGGGYVGASVERPAADVPAASSPSSSSSDAAANLFALFAAVS